MPDGRYSYGIDPCQCLMADNEPRSSCNLQQVQNYRPNFANLPAGVVRKRKLGPYFRTEACACVRACMRVRACSAEPMHTGAMHYCVMHTGAMHYCVCPRVHVCRMCLLLHVRHACVRSGVCVCVCVGVFQRWLLCLWVGCVVDSGVFFYRSRLCCTPPWYACIGVRRMRVLANVCAYICACACISARTRTHYDMCSVWSSTFHTRGVCPVPSDPVAVRHLLPAIIPAGSLSLAAHLPPLAIMLARHSMQNRHS